MGRNRYKKRAVSRSAHAQTVEKLNLRQQASRPKGQPACVVMLFLVPVVKRSKGSLRL